MKFEMPSQEEQDAVVWYVLKRPLVRPDTSYQKAARCILLFMIINGIVTYLLHCLLLWPGISSFLPGWLIDFQNRHPIAALMLLALCQYMLGGLLAMKRAVIGAVRLYQHYAPEDIRRKCLFRPTCSEYTILAVQKYGVVRGLLKSYDRLFRRCKGRIYRIDEP